MDAENWERMQELFEAARSMSPESRASYLRSVCSRAPELQREVEELLEEADSAAGVREISISDLPRNRRPLGLDPGAVLGDYRVIRELGRGGMGVVYEATQISLNRQVALKILHADEGQVGRAATDTPTNPVDSPGNPELIERFVEEAQIGGQLQHPGIVPVYEMGLFADGRRYFTMKLVVGHTLAEMLSSRKSVDEDRVRFLGIFEAACQAMAYAHSNNVLHRDLKPSNIMVGAFGEVQVVDWGLSKVLAMGVSTGDQGPPDTASSAVETAERRPGSLNSRAGHVLGTPAYMSPEQARGEVGKIDKRTDVFGLGAILCEILTGTPPNAATQDASMALQRAAAAKMDGARKRIENSVAAPNLKRLCVTALMPERSKRPRDAGALAKAIHQHLVSVEQRAHQERLKAEQSRRQTQLSLLGGLFLLLAVIGGGGGWWFVQNEARRRQNEVAEALDEVAVDVLRHERAGNFERGLESARSGLLLAQSADAGHDLRTKARKLYLSTEKRWKAEVQRIEAVERELRFLDTVDELSRRFMFPADPDTWHEINADFHGAFRDIGVDLASDDVESLLSEYWGTPMGIKFALVFDGWAGMLRDARELIQVAGQEVDNDLGHDIELLTGIGLALDPDPTRASIREALLGGDSAALLNVARSPDATSAAPETLILLAEALREFGESNEGLRLTMLAAHRYPSSFPLLVAAGSLNIEVPGGLHRAESYLRAAAAIRPDLAVIHGRLGLALGLSGDAVGAIVALERALGLSPDYPWDYEGLATNCMQAGQYEKGLRHIASGPNSMREQILAGFMQVMLGALERDEYIAWFETLPSSDPTIGATPALLLTAMVPAGLAPEPQRALELLRRAEGARIALPHYWISTSAAYVLLGDGDKAIDAASRLELSARGQRLNLCIAYLLQAAGHALMGNGERAEAFVKRARRVRAELYRAHAPQWSGGFIDLSFERFEPIALMR